MNNHRGCSSDEELDAPVAALRLSTQQLLSTMLNPIKIIPAESGLPRDWRGLAELTGMTAETISYLESKNDPVGELLKTWAQSKDLQGRQLSDLKAFLALVDRYDVVEDVAPLLASDAAFFSSRVGISANTQNSVANLDSNLEYDILTIEDQLRLRQGQSLSRYDAFILYSEDDSDFAMQVVEKLEQEYKLKMCVKERDLLPGVMFEHEVIGRLIEERCNRLLVIFSPSFLKSRANQFLVSYAQALALELRQRKIIPCMYQRCELPPSVRYSFCIDYNRPSKLVNFWDKLSQSLKTTPASERKISAPAGVTAKQESSKYESTLPDSLSWWDSHKTVASSYSTTDSGLSSDFNHDQDTVSLKSDTFLLPTVASNPHNTKQGAIKFFKKFRSPMKKMRDKDKNSLKKEAVAE